MSHQSHGYLRSSRVTLGALVVALIAFSFQVVVPRLTPRADASLGTVLCVGFDGCQADGRSNSGYHQHWGTMYWRMYAGRNCVNYAAYRMVAAGMPNVRPWSGSGNAMNWGAAMSSITDTRPRKGAIAWWRSNAPGASSLGHVAYVERVISPTDILVSESNWDGDFDWREITSSDASWPSGFIHFVDKLIHNTKKPFVRGGAPAVGKPLLANGGFWKPRATTSFQWVIGGVARRSRSRSFTPGASALGKQILVRVYARAPKYNVALRVLRLGRAAVGRLTVLGSPRISAEPIVGQRIYVIGDRFDPAVSGHAFQWYADGEPIAGATGRIFTPGYEQVGRTLTATVTGSHRGYRSLRLTSPSTKPVLEPIVAQADPARLTGHPRRMALLAINPGTFVPSAGTTVRYQWRRDGRPIAGATHRMYVPRVADVGHAIAVTIHASAPRYRDLVTTYHVPQRITTESSLRIHHSSTPGTARVTVMVAAPGVARADVVGTLTVHVGRQVQRVSLHHGYAIFVFHHVAGGSRRKLTVSYSGSGYVLHSASTSRMWVKR